MRMVRRWGKVRERIKRIRSENYKRLEVNRK